MRSDITAAARSWLGTPYHHQASLRGIGCDCLGLIRGVWRELLGDEPERLPAYSRDWGDATGAEGLLAAARRNLVQIEKDEASAGDVLLFRMREGAPAKHAGVLVSPSRFIHAQEGLGVVEAELISWWRRRVAATFAFPGTR